MSKVIDFQQAKATQLKKRKGELKQQSRKKLMCQNGHHQWKIVKAHRFDVKEGKLSTQYQCKHCHEMKTEFH